jgi:hypothetical protein
MRFVPVNVGSETVHFSIWETRVRDYQAYANSATGVDASWKDPDFRGQAVTPVGTFPASPSGFTISVATLGSVGKTSMTDRVGSVCFARWVVGRLRANPPVVVAPRQSLPRLSPQQPRVSFGVGWGSGPLGVWGDVPS